MTDKNNAWQHITSLLESDVPNPEFKTWFSNTALRKLEPNLAVIEVPNKFVASWLRDNYMAHIQNSFKEILDTVPEITFTFGTTSALNQAHNDEVKRKPNYKTDHALDTRLTFNNFITAENNQFAYECALSVAKNPASQYNPFYIFSNLSAGKTHLLNAIGNHVVKNHRSFNVRYTTANRFISHFSFCLQKEKLSEFKDAYKNIDILLLDDIHALAGHEKCQLEFISLFNSFYEGKKQIVITANRPPIQIKNMLPQLISRFEWGLLSEIDVPDQNTKMEIIKAISKQAGTYIPDDVIFFLANNTNNLKTITRYLVNLETQASFYCREIDMSTVKSIIKDKQYKKISVEEIQKSTTGYFNISLTDLLSDKKTRKFSYPRQMAMYLTRKLTDLSFKEIGKAFGNKDHSTIIHAVKRIEKDKSVKKSVSDDLDKIQNYLL